MESPTQSDPVSTPTAVPTAPAAPQQIKQAKFNYIQISDIDFTNRIRQDYGDIKELCDSIATKGLLQPVVVNNDKRLIAGGRRLRAHQLLGYTEIAVVFFETLDEMQLRILEVEENVQRKSFNWKERVLAIALAHELARKNSILSGAGVPWMQSQTGELLNMSVGNVNNALKLAAAIRANDEEIVACEKISDALNVFLLRQERKAQKLMAEHITKLNLNATPINIAPLPNVKDLIAGSNEEDLYDKVEFKSIGGIKPQLDDEMPGGLVLPVLEVPPLRTKPDFSSRFLMGDALELMIKFRGKIDHIITDPPYGIDVTFLAQDNATPNTKQLISSVEDTHDPEENVQMFRRFLYESWECLPETGFLVFFCDADHWEKLRDLARKQGFKVQRWPLVWVKTHQCKNQSAQYNFTKNFELAMVCRKGNATMISAQNSSVYSCSNEAVLAELQHPFAKPYDLWQWLMRAVASPGSKILDPFVGVGSSALAAYKAGYLSYGIELEEVHFNRLIINLNDKT